MNEDYKQKLKVAQKEINRLKRENASLLLVIDGIHKDIGLAHDAAHFRMDMMGINYSDKETRIEMKGKYKH